MVIRLERPEEQDAVDRLVYTAFADSYGEETDRLMLRYFTQARRESSFVPELSLVALTDSGEIMGQATLYETDIETPAGKNTQLVLSQSAVLPEYRGQGVMRASGAVFFGGDPKLYGRFGFAPSYRYHIHHAKSAGAPDYAEGCLVCVAGGRAGRGVGRHFL